MMQANTNLMGGSPRGLNNISSDPRLLMTDDPATPIHTSFAKVYTMNPHNKIWLPVSKSPVPVSFYFDKHRSVYRVISYEGTSLIINSTIVPSMTFLKPSSTFGLWSDTKLRTIFGLGFQNQMQRDQTCDWFEKIVKAAALLDQCLPLPPPATTANSVEYEDSVNCQGAMGGSDCINKTQRIELDSTIDLPSSLSIPFPDILMDEYDLENQSSTSEMAHLALKNIQYERETSKLKRLESELISMRTTYTKMHETLLRKITEVDKIRKELTDLKQTLEQETKRADQSEKDTKEEKELVIILKSEISTLKETVKTQSSTIERYENRNQEIERENNILKERLRQTELDIEIGDKSWENVEIYCNELNEKIYELGEIQDKIKSALPTTDAMIRHR